MYDGILQDMNCYPTFFILKFGEVSEQLPGQKTKHCGSQATHSSISQAPVQYLTPALSPADLPSSLIRRSNSKPFLTRHRSWLDWHDELEPGSGRNVVLPTIHLRAHPQQGTEIVAPIANVEDLLIVVHLLAIFLQPALQFVSLAHVDQTAHLTRVLIG